jgi:hypothetical protein
MFIAHFLNLVAVSLQNGTVSEYTKYIPNLMRSDPDKYLAKYLGI